MFQEKFNTAVVRYPSGTWAILGAPEAQRAEQQGRCRVRYVCERKEALAVMDKIVAAMRKDKASRPSAQPSAPSAQHEGQDAKLFGAVQHIKTLQAVINNTAVQAGAIHDALLHAKRGSKEWRQAMNALEIIAGK